MAVSACLVRRELLPISEGVGARDRATSDDEEEGRGPLRSGTSSIGLLAGARLDDVDAMLDRPLVREGASLPEKEKAVNESLSMNSKMAVSCCAWSGCPPSELCVQPIMFSPLARLTFALSLEMRPSRRTEVPWPPSTAYRVTSTEWDN